MIPTDIVPLKTTPVQAAAGRSRKKEDAAEDAGDTGFAGAMKQVANGKKQSTTTARQPGQAQETANVRVRLSAAERSERGGRVLADHELGKEAESEGTDAPESEDGEGQVLPTQGEKTSRGAHDVLAMMMAHGHVHATQRNDEMPSAPATDGKQIPAVPDKDTAAAIEKLNVVSIRTETHLARTNAQPVSTDVAQKLAQLGNGRATGAGKAAEQTTAAKVTGPIEPGAGTKASDAGAADAILRAPGQQGAEADASQGAGANPAGVERGAKDDAKLALRASGNAEAAQPLADKATPPAPAGSPMEQLVPRLIDTAREMKGADPTAAAASTRAATDLSAGPMRVLSIDLHPAELGSVTVRMSLAGETLGVQIEAARPETARLLQNDASTLSDMLRTAGVQVDGVTVRAAYMDTVAGGAGTSQSFMHENSQSQPGGAQADARASGGNGREQNRQPFGEGRQDQGQGGQQRSQHDAGRGLFV